MAFWRGHFTSLAEPGPEDLPRGHAMTPMEVYKLEATKCLSDDPLCEKLKHCMDQAALASLSASVSAKGSALRVAPKANRIFRMESLSGVLAGPGSQLAQRCLGPPQRCCREELPVTCASSRNSRASTWTDTKAAVRRFDPCLVPSAVFNYQVCSGGHYKPTRE
eukprot:s123_g36.t1